MADHIRIESSSLPSSTARPYLKSRAEALRGIRIGSLMHGTPEAIPIRQGIPGLLRFSPADDACHETLAWSWHGWRHTPITWLNFNLYLGTRRFKLGTRHCGPGNCERVICVFEAPELRALLKELLCWTSTEMESYSSETCTVLGIQLLVQRAILEGETVLWWEWPYPYA